MPTLAVVHLGDQDEKVPRRKDSYVSCFSSFAAPGILTRYQLPPLPTLGGAHTVAQPPHIANNGAQPPIHDRGRPTFGVDLAEQMARDSVEIPQILQKCCAAIEKYGLYSQGIYRISGMARKVNLLKERLDKGDEHAFIVI
jgi:hypothetical protein